MPYFSVIYKVYRMGQAASCTTSRSHFQREGSMQKGSEPQLHMPKRANTAPGAMAAPWGQRLSARAWMDRAAECLSTRGMSRGPQEEGSSTQAIMPTSLEDTLASEMTAAAHTQGALTHGGPRSQTQMGEGQGLGSQHCTGTEPQSGKPGRPCRWARWCLQSAGTVLSAPEPPAQPRSRRHVACHGHSGTRGSWRLPIRRPQRGLNPAPQWGPGL